MGFNYDNPNMCAMAGPHNAACQFMMNCIGFTRNLAVVGTNEFIDETIAANGLNYQSKFDTLVDQFPRPSDHSWHQRMLTNTAWWTTAPYAKERLDIEDHSISVIHMGFDDAKVAKKYMDQHWRDPAIKVSNSNLGFVLPSHQTSELDAWVFMFPNIKYFTITNYHNWIKNISRKKNTFNIDIQRWWDSGKAIYEPKGFIFDLESLLFKAQSFDYQMAHAYEYFGFDDYDRVKDLLEAYRRKYLEINVNWNKSKEIS